MSSAEQKQSLVKDYNKQLQECGVIHSFFYENTLCKNIEAQLGKKTRTN